MNGETAFSYGQKYENTDIRTSKLWYLQAVNDREYREKALLKLLEINIRYNNFKTAREIIPLIKDFNSQFYLNLGVLEGKENNYSTAMDYFSRSMCDPDDQIISLIYIANMYVEFGEYETARRIYETINSVLSFLGQLNIDLVTKDFKHGLKLCENNPHTFIRKSHKMYFEAFYTTFMYYIGRDSEIKENYNAYTLNRLKSTFNDNTLIKHISKHKSDEGISESVFFSDLNLEKLVRDVEKIIKPLNPQFDNGVLKYNLRLDYEVGTFSDEVTRDVCVVTTIDPSKILTIYPKMLSNEFDREKLQKSVELRRKRILGR